MLEFLVMKLVHLNVDTIPTRSWFAKGPPALQRERQLKCWSRAKKLALIRNQTALLKKLSHSTRFVA
jgi:predicted GIY-YIG superfamily endonuclease